MREAAREAVIVSSVRTAVGKATKGTLRATRPDDLAAVAISEAIGRVPSLDPKEIEDVILGCAMPEAEQGMNVARIASLRAGLPVEASAMTINRFCSSGLQAIAIAAERIIAGHGDVAVAGGTESMSMVPMGGNKVAPNPWLMDHYPDAYLGMGLDRGKSGEEIWNHARAVGRIFVCRAIRKRWRRLPRENSKTKIVPVEVSYTVRWMGERNGANAMPKTVKVTLTPTKGRARILRWKRSRN